MIKAPNNGFSGIISRIRAFDSTGLNLTDDGGNGIFVQDGGNVGIGTDTPSKQLELTKSMELPKTIDNTIGIIFKNGSPFIHDFSHQTGDSAVPLGDNLFIGDNAGNFTVGATAYSDTHGSYNAAIGKNALQSLTIGYGNTAFGLNVGKSITTGYNNVGLGANCMTNLTVGTNNIVAGFESLSTATACYFNVAMGYQAMKDTTTGSYSVGIGYNALTKVTNAYYNAAIGHFAGSNITTGVSNVAIGPLSLRNTTTGSYNTAIGMQACFNQVSLTGTTAIGAYTLKDNVSGTQNTAIGYETLQAATSSNNTGIGYSALRNSINGGGNTAVGANALGLGGLSGFTVENSTAIGMEALKSTFASSGCVAVGYRAGLETIDSPGFPTYLATDSIFIGRDTKSKNLFVNAQNQIVIGAGAASIGDNTTVIGNSSCTITALRGKVGAGVDAPATSLHASGAITANELSADPANPAEGSFVTWMSNGTGSGDDGDIMVKITAGGTTKTITLIDFSAA